MCVQVKNSLDKLYDSVYPGKSNTSLGMYKHIQFKIVTYIYYIRKYHSNILCFLLSTLYTLSLPDYLFYSLKLSRKKNTTVKKISTKCFKLAMESPKSHFILISKQEEI